MRKLGKNTLLVVSCAIGCALGAAPGTARALSCATNNVMRPVQNQTGVPTDALLWGYPLANTRLLGPSGETIALTERALVVSLSATYRGSVPVLVPSSELQPDTRYTIELKWSDEYDVDP